MQQPCVRCGATNQPGASTCVFCGSLLNSYAAPQQVSPSGSYDPTQRVSAPGSYDATQRVPPPGIPSGSYQPPSAPYNTPYYPPAPPPPPPPPVAPPYPAAQPVYFAAPAQPVVVLAPVPQQKKSHIGLILAIVLPLLAIMLIVCAVLVVPFFVIAQQQSAPRPPLYTDALTADKGVWQCQPGAQCQFAADGYHILAPDNHVYASELSSQQFSNAVIEVKGKIAQGNPQQSGLALLFRIFLEPDAYVFLVFGDGSYELAKWDENGNVTRLISPTPSSAIHTTLNQTNDLKVSAVDDTLTLFVNGKQLNQVTDASYSIGSIALGATGAGTQAVFTDLTVNRP